MTSCLRACDHCQPEALHPCVRPPRHRGYHSCELQDDDLVLDRYQIHEVEDGYVIAEQHVWLPGIYDTPETAVAAAQLDDAQLAELNRRICHVDTEARSITAEDLPGG